MPRDIDAHWPPPRRDGQSPAAPSRPADPPDAGDRWTVGRLLVWTSDFLKRRGAESPRLDAEVLLARFPHLAGQLQVKTYRAPRPGAP